MITIYSRLENETDDELIFRICSEKDAIGTWRDVANVINSITGNSYGESSYRKKFQAFQKMLDANQKKFASVESQLSELRYERQKLEKEKVKIRDERTELRRVIREEARKESYKDQIKRAIESMPMNPLEYHYDKKDLECNHDNDLIISCTDIHTGIEIDNYFNKFNQEVLKHRFQKYIDKIIEVQMRHKSTDAYLIISEIISGFIHNELRIENNQDMIEQFLTITSYLSDFLAELSYHFENVHVFCVPGNHSRLSPKKEDSLKGENMDHLAIPFLKAKLQNFDNIKFYDNVIDESIASFTVRGNFVMAAHGDKDDPSSVVQKFTMLASKKPSIIYLGHRHTNGLSTVYNTKIVQSGSMSGVDNYCLDHRLINEPEQTISVITEDGLNCLYNVSLCVYH